MSNSCDAEAILTASGMGPGSLTAGTVVIANTGTLTGEFALSTANLVDTSGPNGGTQWGRLELRVRGRDEPRPARHVYAGKMIEMGPQDLGARDAGVSRAYRFTVSFPNGGHAS